MDTLERFPLVWCDTCSKTQSIIFDVMQANEKNDHDAADIICASAVDHHDAACSEEHSPNWRAYQKGREGIRDGCPGNRASD
jgi:hypothetical protein